MTMKQGVTKRCRLSWLTNSVLVYEPKCGGEVGVAGSQQMSTAVHLEPQIKFVNLTPYLTFGMELSYRFYQCEVVVKNRRKGASSAG